MYSGPGTVCNEHSADSVFTELNETIRWIEYVEDNIDKIEVLFIRRASGLLISYDGVQTKHVPYT